MEIDQDFKEFITLLNKHNVHYLVVGGYAVGAYGYPRYTGDIDFWVKADEHNSKNIIQALLEFGFGSLDLNESDFIRPNFVVQLGYPPNRIDILTGVSGLIFDECWNERQVIKTQDIEMNFISLDDLIKNKQASGRLQDLADAEKLSKYKK